MFTTSNEPCELHRLVRWRIKLSLLLLLTIASNLACAQTTTTLYKSIGPDGKATYSDRPTPTAREAKALTFYSAPASPLSAETLAYIDQLGKSADARPPVSSSDTVLFSAVWCGYCKQAKAYLVSKHVAYRELDIDTKDGLVAYARAGGKRGVPLLLANGQSVTGFSTSAYDALFAAHRQ